MIDKIKFFKKEGIKLRLSIPLIKGAIDSKEKLNKLINLTDSYVDEYVVRTLYPKTPNLEELYVDFNYNHEKVVIERENDISNFDGLILWSDNKFYNNWELNSYKYFNSYLLLKPDSKTYINEIEELINKNGFEVKKRLLLSNFKDNALRLYIDKDEEYLKKIKRHLESVSFLFGDNALLLILDNQCCVDELYFKTLKLKEEIRQKYSFRHAYGGFLTKDDKISHINIAHCPDACSKYFNRDLNFLLQSNIDIKEIDEIDFQKVKKYRSFNL